ncbi:MAG TPA: hypothetical protein VFP84_36175 [Kofleriaceae bacterium]|nr:hypothetical protein [Kofleriaceae bacterium]
MILLSISACGFPALERADDGGMGGNVDSPPDAQQCFGSIVKVCFANNAALPTTNPLPQDATIQIDTDSDPLCNAHDNDQKANYCVIAGNAVILASTQSIRGYGSKPLVLLATRNMDIEGTVDVSSNRNPDPIIARGAGANPAVCTGGVAPTGSGGGFGGSFGGKGGAGETVIGGGGGIGGTPADPLTSLPAVLRGGCSGSAGGNTGGGAAGIGGGAVALVASQISLNGKVNASGGGGKGGAANQVGGGGGGAGGMIILDADPTKIGGTGLVFANGGGGGQGGSPGGGHDGDDGGESAAPATAATGGAGTGGKDGGSGGTGSFGTSLVGRIGSGSQNQGGGGGGGGGAGFVHAPTLNPANVAPPSKDPT